MHNDADGAVPWYQGIELFVALRRLGKEVYMVNTWRRAQSAKTREPEGHRHEDAAVFRHEAQGRAAAGLDVRGIPALDKGRDQIAPKPTVIPAPIPEAKLHP